MQRKILDTDKIECKITTEFETIFLEFEKKT